MTLVGGVLLLSLGPGLSSAETRSSRAPNIVLILADDMGYGDPGCYNGNSKIPTPNIDQLALEGVRMTDAHAPGSVCVPSRYGLLTGCYPMRMERGRRGPLIDPDQLTLGSMLRQHGYRTGCVGKWHLGFEGDDYDQPMRGGPVDRGFDYYFGIPASLDIPPYYYIENDRCVEAPTDRVEANYSENVTRIQGAFWRAGGIAPGLKHVEVMPKLTEKAVAFVDGCAERSPKPFFLYFALPAPHTPWLPTEAFQGKSDAGDYGDYTVQVDAAVGRVLDALDRHQLADNSIVLFTSDNGPVWYDRDVAYYDHASVGELRGMKGDAWEGGHRMPFVARWPGMIPQGNVSDETISFTDMLATLAAVVGHELPDDAAVDSYNVLPALLGQKLVRPIREATVFLSSGRLLSIRQGPWKLIPQLGSGGFSEPRRGKPEPDGPEGQLYDLDKDPAETTNLWHKHPEIVERLTALLQKYETTGRSVPPR